MAQTINTNLGALTVRRNLDKSQGDLATAGGAGNEQAIVDAIDGAWAGTSASYSGAYVAARYMHEQVKAAGGEGMKDVMEFLSSNANATLDQALNGLATALGGPIAGWTSTANFLADFDTNGDSHLAAMNLANADTGAIGGLDADGGAVRTASSVVANSGTKTGAEVLSGFAESFEAVATGTGARTAPT